MTDDTDENVTPADATPPPLAVHNQTPNAGEVEAPVVAPPPPGEELVAVTGEPHEGVEEYAAPPPELEPSPTDEAPGGAGAPGLLAADHTHVGEDVAPALAAEEPGAAEADVKTAAARKSRKAAKVADAEELAGDPAAETVTVATAEGEVPAAAGEVAAGEPPPQSKKKWYAVKIQSGREESIKAAIERKVKIEGLEEYFGQIVIPVEEMIVKKKVKVKNKKTGETTTQEKNVSKFNKKFPGYLFAEVEFNDEILYVFRETSGVGDFVGVNTKKTQGAVERQPPTPMTDAEVQSMLTGIPDKTKPRGGKGKVVVKLDVEKGDKVRIRNGAFANNEGEVKAITEPKDPADTPKVTVVVTLWGRPVEVELDYWEVDKV